MDNERMLVFSPLAMNMSNKLGYLRGEVFIGGVEQNL